ncbi:MAG: radical SAM protein [Oscillibacter sp.]|nr:radical SAM protein [Oscillibacter sp.]
MICALCPRDCHALRTETRGGGVCGMPSSAVVAKAMLHRWEEPCLTGTNGAGAVFFAGCSLGCVYCQNRAISRPDALDVAGLRSDVQSRESVDITGLRPDTRSLETVDAAGLRGIFRDLVARGAACLDLVTPTHFTPAVAAALRGVAWPVPVVWNSGGYEKADTLRALDGLVQVYLPDLKYALPGPAEAYSGAPDYFQWAAPAIAEMFRQTGPYCMRDGRLSSGVLIRHMVIPGELENTRRVIDWVSRTFRPGDVLFSLLRQYTPQPGATGNLSRRVTGGEYRAAVAYMRNCGITDGYTQDAASAVSDYTPDF